MTQPKPVRRFNDEFDYPGTPEQEEWAGQFVCPHCGPATNGMVMTTKCCLRCASKQCPKGSKCIGQSLIRP